MKEASQEKKEKSTTKKQSVWSACVQSLKAFFCKKLFGALLRFPFKKYLKCLKFAIRKYAPACCCFVLCLVILFAAMALAVSAAVCDKTEEKILKPEDVQDSELTFDCIMILGCKAYPDGSMSHMLEDRVKVGIALYQSGLSDVILMSGDSHQPEVYDEVGAMKAAAMAAGVPEEAILTDPYGLSTYDSVAHLSQLFEGKRVLIVTQGYHLYRAVYVAEKLGLEAYGATADLRSYRGQLSRDLREIAARCKDVFYALKQPVPAGPDPSI